MTEARRLKEIRERQRRGDPLNLSAIRIECPHLLDGLFDPADFRGWRETLEAAGVDVARMAVVPLSVAECLHCGYRADSLARHLAEAHGQNSADYRREFRDGETWCEEVRAGRMGDRHGRPAKLVMPHWEPAWSHLYALDRLHYCHLRGHPVNRSYWTRNEPGLEGYLRRLYVHWEPVIEAIGLDPDRERAAKKVVHSEGREEIRHRLRAVAAKDPKALRPSLAGLKGQGALLRSAILAYGSFEAALEDAEIEPVSVMPVIGISAERGKRRRLLAECRNWLRDAPDYDPARVAALHQEHDRTVAKFYGSWRTLLALLGSSPRKFFRSPPRGSCGTPKAVIAALRTRERAGSVMTMEALRLDWPGLYFDATDHFGSLEQALEAAGIDPVVRGFRSRHYKRPEDLIDALKRWHRAGRGLYPLDLLEDREGRIIHKWAVRYFGSYQEALEAAGFDPVERRPFSFPERVRYPDADSVIAGIHARHRAGLSLGHAALFRLKEEGGDKTLALAGSRNFGNWEAAVFEAGYDDVDHCPDHPSRIRFWTKRDVIEALRAIHAQPPEKASETMRRESNLQTAAGRFFGSMREAMVAAGLLSRRKAGPAPYRNRTEVLAALRERANRGQPLDLPTMLRAHRGNRPLAEAARREFGSWQAVLAAIGQDAPSGRRVEPLPGSADE